MVARLIKKAPLATVFLLLTIAFVGQAPALAVSGMSLSGDAAQAQYPRAPTSAEGETLDNERGREEAAPPDGGQGPASGVGGEAQSTGVGGDQRLPFTGFLAAAVLLTGVAMLAGGFALRQSRSAKRA
jgi:hypothetical protein